MIHPMGLGQDWEISHWLLEAEEGLPSRNDRLTGTPLGGYLGNGVMVT